MDTILKVIAFLKDLLLFIMFLFVILVLLPYGYFRFQDYRMEQTVRNIFSVAYDEYQKNGFFPSVVQVNGTTYGPMTKIAYNSQKVTFVVDYNPSFLADLRSDLFYKSPTIGYATCGGLIFGDCRYHADSCKLLNACGGEVNRLQDGTPIGVTFPAPDKSTDQVIPLHVTDALLLPNRNFSKLMFDKNYFSDSYLENGYHSLIATHAGATQVSYRVDSCAQNDAPCVTEDVLFSVDIKALPRPHQLRQ